MHATTGVVAYVSAQSREALTHGRIHLRTRPTTVASNGQNQPKAFLLSLLQLCNGPEASQIFVMRRDDFLPAITPRAGA